MKKVMKAVGITAALAVMIPLSAYAATTNTGASSTGTDTAAQTRPADGDFGRGPRPEFKGGAGGMLDQSVLDLLKLDKTALQTKIKEGKTLNEIAEEQGVTRDALKAALTDAFTKKQEEQKQKFTENLDKVLDGKLKDQPGSGVRPGGKFGMERDLSPIATALGLTNDELMTSLKGGKSITDLAAEKSVDVQTLIDAQKAAFVEKINKELTDGKITQEQADKMIANAAARAEDIVNGKGFGRGDKGPRPDGHGADKAKTEKAKDDNAKTSETATDSAAAG
ncbi:hypothetical protein ACFOLF_11640 [Paenibacillus sepulcri]|uniref:LysM domain-containing protein n=1 Tax=Paenibacillus sepulcri TaxID=359917 RepID=A0ABS7C5G2_9BACL|nr:hypothetical protein [Paenibacillus sepulcri]